MISDTAQRGGFFGRRIGKPLGERQLADRDAIVASLGLNLDTPAPADLATLFTAPVRRFHCEIGFGGGEHLLAHLRRAPDTGFFGAEAFANGISRFGRALIEAPASNIRIHADDAVTLLDWLPSASLDGIDLFYPDPWSKKRHWKRRFVGPANLDRFARVLKPGGMFRFASDVPHYVNWTLAACAAHGLFDWTATGPDDWRKPYPDWPGTRYEAKALNEGRTPAYLTFHRI